MSSSSGSCTSAPAASEIIASEGPASATTSPCATEVGRYRRWRIAGATTDRRDEDAMFAYEQTRSRSRRRFFPAMPFASGAQRANAVGQIGARKTPGGSSGFGPSSAASFTHSSAKSKRNNHGTSLARHEHRNERCNHIGHGVTDGNFGLKVLVTVGSSPSRPIASLAVPIAADCVSAPANNPAACPTLKCTISAKAAVMPSPARHEKTAKKICATPSPC